MKATSTQRPSGTSYIPTLDGWRAIAIIAVMFCHGLDDHIYPFAVPLGFAGVLLFFAISGFLITSRMLEESRLTGTISLRKFYVRRSFRILPPALFYLAVVTVLGLAGIIPFYFGSILRALLFVRNYTFLNYANPGTWFSAHFWSLSVEEHFYLIWPTIFILVGLRRVRWVAPLLAIATIVWRTIDGKYDFIARWTHAPFLTSNWGRTDYLADVLLWGCTLAIWLGPKPWKSPLPRGTTTLVCMALIAFQGVALFTSHFSHARNFVNLFMALLVGATVTDPASLFSRFLEWAPLRYIGRLSYSLYLWQQLFFHVDRAPLRFQRFPLNVLLIFACACFSYYLVERPTVRLGHRFAKPPKLGHADDVQPAVTVS
jgi:peptidoglycan/LPS O-acetylase OafA/YrhL